MKLRKEIYLAIVMMLIAPVSKAYTTGDGFCHSVEGPYIYSLNLNGQQIPADKNQAGMEVRDLATLSSSSRYKVQCNCLTHFTTTFPNIYYTAKTQMNIDTERSGYTYYHLNDNLSIATSIYILGRGFIPVPFESQPNRVDIGSWCDAPGEEGSKPRLDTGSEVKISFLVNKPFIGRVNIPATTITRLYGGIDAASSAASPNILAEISIAGEVEVPQRCEIAQGQTLEIDFGKIPATQFSTTKGSAVSTHKVKKTIQVQCTGMRNEDILSSSFQADPVDADATMLKVVGNDDVGIVIYDKWDRVVNVNGGALGMDMSADKGGIETNSLTFSAAPASATGALPKPGTFDAYATITLEIKN